MEDLQMSDNYFQELSRFDHWLDFVGIVSRQEANEAIKKK